MKDKKMLELIQDTRELFTHIATDLEEAVKDTAYMDDFFEKTILLTMKVVAETHKRVLETVVTAINEALTEGD